MQEVMDIENLNPNILLTANDEHNLSTSLSNISFTEFLQDMSDIDFNHILPEVLDFEEFDPYLLNNNNCMTTQPQVSNPVKLEPPVVKERQINNALTINDLNEYASKPEVNDSIKVEPPVAKQPPKKKTSVKSKVKNNNESQQSKVNAADNKTGAYVEIVEQPCPSAMRFRYQCEGRSASGIQGANSTITKKTYPTIRVVGYQGRALAVVSCVTKDPPYQPHPFNLVGNEFCKKGICAMSIPTDTMTASFEKLSVQCTKKKDMKEELDIREEIQIDPFRTGFDHKNDPGEIDSNAVRLCFQVFIEVEKGNCSFPLKPVVSDPIYHKKAKNDLKIRELSLCSASVAGGTKILLFTEKFIKNDLEVRFFEEKNGEVVWEALADYKLQYSHKQVALKFFSPPYKNQQIEEPVKVYIQLRRPSDGGTSDRYSYEFLPEFSCDANSLKRKRQKYESSPSSLLLKSLQSEIASQPELTNALPAYNYNNVKPERNGCTSAYKPAPAYVPIGAPNFPANNCTVSPTGVPYSNQCQLQYNVKSCNGTPQNFQYPTFNNVKPLTVRNNFY